MTQIIDVNLSSIKLTPSHTEKSFRHWSVQSTALHYMQNSTISDAQNCCTFIYETQELQFDLLFDVRRNYNYAQTKIYLLLQNGQIFKLQFQLQRVLAMKNWLCGKDTYQVNIDPSTGFVYFKVGYFDFRKINYRKMSIKEILKQICLKRVYQSVQKLSGMGFRQQEDKIIANVWNEEKSYLQMSKFIAKMTESQDVQSIFAKKNYSSSSCAYKSAEKHTISHLSHLIQPKHHEQNSPSLTKLNFFLTSLSQQHIHLSQVVKRKTGRSNYDQLLVTSQTIKRLNELIDMMVYKKSTQETFKTTQAEFGKITLSLQLQEEKIYKQKIALLQSLSKHTEYHFLDKYFKTTQNVPIIIALSLKDETLCRFLETNKLTISIQTKLRIMLQIYSAVTILWEESKTLLYVNTMRNIYVTKNLTVKLRGVDIFYKPDHHVLLQEKDVVNVKLVQNLLNLSKIYYKMMFNHDLVYVRPLTNGDAEMKFCNIKQKLQTLTHPSVMPEGNMLKGLTQLLTGLAYVFDEHVEITRRTVDEQMRKMKQNQREVFNVEKEDEFQYQEPMNKKISNDQGGKRFLNYKYTCCWLMKILQAVAKEKD